MTDRPSALTTTAETVRGSTRNQNQPENAQRPPRYVLGRELAQGGMGRIHEGKDLHLGRDVAIKVVTSADPERWQLFEREARIAAQLAHPGIVAVHDLGHFPTGEPFLVMNLVRGRPFDRVIADADSLDDRLGLLPICGAVADAIAFAHDRGFVHRDLKPNNVLVGAFGEVAVVDWGLAKSMADPSQEGDIMGTPAYMPPEQARGAPVGYTADVYAIGAIVYHALTGVPPHGVTQASRALHDARDRPPPLLGVLEPRLPQDLTAIIDKAMAWNAADRYPTAFELAEDLRRFHTGHLVAARRYSPVGRAWRQLRRLGWMGALVLATVMGMALGRLLSR